MKETVIAIVAAVIGSVVAWLLGASDRKSAKQVSEFQRQNLVLEKENAKLHFIERFSPRVRFSRSEKSEAFQQFIELSAGTIFSVVLLEYLSEDDVCHASETHNVAGEVVKLPLSNEYSRQSITSISMDMTAHQS
jgi:hypothetical protein